MITEALPTISAGRLNFAADAHNVGITLHDHLRRVTSTAPTSRYRLVWNEPGWSGVQDVDLICNYRPRVKLVEHPMAGIVGLSDGWDGPDALAPRQETIASAAWTLYQFSSVLPNPEVTANPDGTITFDWESTRGYASLEIGATRFGLVVKFDGKQTRFAKGLNSQLDGTIALEIRDLLFPLQSRASSMWNWHSHMLDAGARAS